MPPRKRKSLTVQQSNNPPSTRVARPVWQKRISTFFINPHSNSERTVTSSSSVSDGPDNSTVRREYPEAANPPKSSPSVGVKDVLKHGLDIDQQTRPSTDEIIDFDEVEKTHSSDGLSSLQRSATEETNTCSEITNIREDAAYLEEDEGLHPAHNQEYVSEKTSAENLLCAANSSGVPIRPDICNMSSELLVERSCSTVEEKNGGGSVEQTIGAGTPDAVAMYRRNVFSWQLKLKAPKGHQLVENFITIEEEEHLLHCLDNDLHNPWKISRVNGVHMGKAFGVISARRIFTDKTKLPPMPKFVKPYVERMRREVPALKDFVPNEMNAIDYRKSEGHWLKAHMDDRQLSGTILVNLSLSGTCVMTYAQEKRGAGEVFRVKLAPRSLQILTGESRYNFTHGIQKDDFLSPRRVSMTFRQSIPQN